ncbi:MAG: hypothetical protein R6U89_02500 [Dehalococcoidia bacterium]
MLAGASGFNTGDTVKTTDLLNVRTGPGLSYDEISDPDYAANNWCAPAGEEGVVLAGPSYADGYTWYKIDFGPGLYTGWSSDHRLVKVEAQTFSAGIVDYVPTSITEVEAGDSVTIGASFVNTGNTAWQFVAGATVWDSNGNQVANYSETLSSALQPDEQHTVTWRHPVTTEGDYWVQFGVWKDTPYISENLLDKAPSPSQKLISVTEPQVVDNAPPVIENLSAYPSSITEGESVTISFSVSDSGGSGLNRAELWKKFGSGNWEEVDHKYLNGDQSEGSFTDIPQSAGNFQYSLHVADNAGNLVSEDRQVEVEADEPEPTVSPVQPDPADIIPPSVDYFNISPTEISPGESVNVDYTVSDSGSGLKTIELWRKREAGSWEIIDLTVIDGTGDTHTTSFIDSLTSSGTFYYALNVFDKDGNQVYEEYGTSVLVVENDPTTTPTPTPTEPSPELNQPPYVPENPFPADGESGIKVNSILNWNGGDPDGDAVFYDVYLEKENSSPDKLLVENLTHTSFDPENLEYDSHYYWRVKAEDTKGNVAEGPVWDFYTDSCPVNISAQIDSYIPSGLTEVEAGNPVTIGVSFANTGNTTWQFIAGATVWDSNGNQVANYSETLSSALQPDEQHIVTWSHPVTAEGDYWVQFGVWKDTPFIAENLLDKAPSPSQKLISVTESPVVDDTSPVIEDLSVYPSSITEGESVTINFSLRDRGGSGLKQVELWRRQDTSDWQEVNHKKISGNYYTGTFSDTPPSAGTWEYGLHVLDNAGNITYEDQPLSVLVEEPERTPSPTPSSTPTPSTHPYHTDFDLHNMFGFDNGSITGSDIESYISSTYPTSPMLQEKAIGDAFINAGQEYQVNPAFLVATAQHEGGFGTLGWASSHYHCHNTMGWCVNPDHPHPDSCNCYDSWSDCIQTTAERIANGPYYYRYSPSRETVDEIRDVYAEHKNTDTIVRYMNDLYWFSQVDVDITNWGPTEITVEARKSADNDIKVSYELIDKNNKAIEIPHVAHANPPSVNLNGQSLTLGSSNLVFLHICLMPQNNSNLDEINDIRLRIVFQGEKLRRVYYLEPGFDKILNIVSSGFDITRDGYSFSNNSFNKGKCYGMAATSILYFNDELARPSGFNTTYALDTNTAEPAIDRYQDEPFLNNIDDRSALFEDNKLDMTEYAELRRILGQRGPVIVILHQGILTGHHAVVAYKLIEEDNKSYIAIYDPNWPYKPVPSNIKNAFTYIEYDHLTNELEYGDYNRFKFIEARKDPWYQRIEIFSPAEVRVRDSQGRTTGMINGQILEEIPFSCYDNETETVTVYHPDDTFMYEVAGNDNGYYGLEITSTEFGKTKTITLNDVPTTGNSSHLYSIDWKELTADGHGITVEIDSDGDGIFEEKSIPNKKSLTVITDKHVPAGKADDRWSNWGIAIVIIGLAAVGYVVLRL